MATSITLSQKSQAGKDITRSITNIDPDASNGQISAFALALNHLTTNHLNQVNRIDKTEVDILETYHTLEVSYEVLEGEESNYTFANNVLTVKYNNLPANFANGDGIVFYFKVNNVSIPLRTITVTRKTAYGFDIETSELDAFGVVFYKFVEGTFSPQNIADFEQTITIPQGKTTVGQDVIFYNASTVTIKLTA